MQEQDGLVGSSSHGMKRQHEEPEVSCFPRNERQRLVQQNLYRTCHVPGLHAAMPRSSPVLVDLFKRQIRRKLKENEEQDEMKGVDLEMEMNSNVEQDPEVKTLVHVTYLLAFCTMVMMNSIAPTLLLYLHHVGFTGDDDIGFYVTCSVIATAVPVFSHTAVGSLASIVGPRDAMAVTSVVVGLALVGMSIPLSRPFFALMYGIYSLSQSIRTIRTFLLSIAVPAADRTRVMSIHMLMTPLGAIVGPFIWLLADSYPYQVPILGRWKLDSYTINFGTAALVSFGSAIIARTALPENVSRLAAENEQKSSSQRSDIDPVVVHMEDGHDYAVLPAEYRFRVFRYFCILMFSVNLSMGIFMVAFQPLMIARFHVSGKVMGWIFEIISVTALIPPLLVAYLSQRLKDRQIMVIGLTAKLCAILMYLPIFGPVQPWQIVVGYILMIKASIFFFTSVMSLFTKLLGDMSSGTLVGVLSSLSALGPALAQLFFARYILSYAGTFWFGVFGLPVLFAMAMIMYPWFWQRLDPEREFVTKLLHSYHSIR